MNPSFTNSEILDILKEARLFAQFTDDQLRLLISFSSTSAFDAGQTIIEQEVQNDKFYILLKGAVSVYTDNEFILRLKRQGDLVGEMSVITKLPTTARVVADSPVELFSISAEKIEHSDQAELKSTVFKLFLDILIQKLTLTTRQVIGYQATTDELSVKKEELAKSEDVIQQKEAILQQVLGSMSDGVVVMEREGKVLHVNAAFREMIGGRTIPEELSDWPAELGLYRSDESTLYRSDQLPMSTIFTEKPVDSEELMVMNGSLPESIWLQASSRMLTSKNSPAPQGAVVVFRDFTKKKLEEKSLIAAKENAEATARAKSDFLSVMSHELRTPLNGIMGMTDLIYSTSLTAEQRNYLDTLKSSSENLLNLIRNILDYNNLESDDKPLKLEPFSLQACFGEIRSTYEILARKKGLALRVSVSDELPDQLLGNVRGILQIMRNLTDNAVKFTEKGTIALSAKLISLREDTAEIQISVEDSGIGIKKDRIRSVFELFSQVDSSFSRDFDGAGIGLSLCQKYVDRMQGEITVDSTPGVGSRFNVFLKLELPPSRQISPSQGDEEDEPDESFSEKHPMAILVAEDNALNQKLISKVLQKLGYQPEIVNNGLEAVERNRNGHFDLILMDLQMPKMDGLEASRIIRDEANSSEKPSIIALTANVSEEVRESCLAAGMTDFTTKPLKIKHLVRLLQKLN